MNTRVAPVPVILAPTLLMALTLAPFSPASASARQTTVLTEDLCTTCSIELTPDVLLGTDGESVIGMAWDIQRLSDGRFTMAFGNIAAWPEFTVFSADGSDFRRIGRDGEGPGEYIRVLSVRELGEELHVLDNHRRRITVLDPGFEVVRTIPLVCLNCNGFDMAMLPGGRMALNYFMSTGSLEEALAADAGFAVHILGPDGESLHSVDEIPASSPMNPAQDPSRFLDVAPDGSLLSLHLTSYRIDRWDPDTGELLQTFERGADWFPDGRSPSHSARPERPPATGTRAMHVDEAGRVWVQIGRPAPDWEDHLVETPPDMDPKMGPWMYGPGSTEGVIEVLDLESGRVLMSQVLDSEVLGGWGKLFAPGWLAVYDEEGIPQYRMWRVRLEGLAGRND
ncbi:MAG: 6-bladed beta-propeller [Gemmatimonadota bacterium]|nr:6-bladed beta-propeller [Gemmatimonadota bacterium]